MQWHWRELTTRALKPAFKVYFSYHLKGILPTISAGLLDTHMIHVCLKFVYTKKASFNSFDASVKAIKKTSICVVARLYDTANLPGNP